MIKKSELNFKPFFNKQGFYEKIKEFLVFEKKPVGQGVVGQGVVGQGVVGQGTIEYLVIIAIVIVISLVLVVLLLNQTSSVSETDQKNIVLSWQTKELSVVDFVSDASGQGIIIVKNNLPDNIVLDSIIIGDSTNSYSKQLFLGSTQRFSLNGLTECIQQNQKYEIIINYTTKNGLQKSIKGFFYSDCVENALSLNYLNFTSVNASPTTNTSIITSYLTLLNSNAISTDLNDNFTHGTNDDGFLVVNDNELFLGVDE
jgi:hypothetical protein